MTTRAAFLAVTVFAAACAAPAPARVAYTPKVREITVTTVPLLVKEEKSLYPFLAEATKKGGSLDGKEVYGYSPSSLTVVEGDTIHFTFVNPEDDAHGFVLPDFAASLAGNSITRATYVAKHAGIFTFQCSVGAHLPMMSGTLTVLSAEAVTSH